MNYNPQIHHRRSIRFREYDYTNAGAYFVTICTWNRECIFGEISGGNMLASEHGEIANKCWQWLPGQYSYIELDEFVIMPNHLHGIIVINDSDECRGGSRTAPTVRRKPLGRIIGAFKTVSTKQTNQNRNTPGMPVWQRNYYERVIRNEKELYTIREYIRNNSLQWELDENNPVNL